MPSGILAPVVARADRMTAIEAVPEFTAMKTMGRELSPAHRRIGQTYLPIQVSTVAGVQTSRPV